MKKVLFVFTALFSLLLTQGSIAQSPIQLSDGIYKSADGTAYSGEILAHREDGTLRSVHTVVNGLFDGPARFYDAAQKLEEIGAYERGEKHGMWQRFNPSGLLVGEAYYRAGQKDGVWTVWDDQGVKRYHMVYSMGKKIDVWQMWDEDANLVSEKVYTN